MSNGLGTDSADQVRIKYGFIVVIVGLALVGAIAGAAIAKWTAASDVTAVVGSVAGVVGTVVGAFFGVQVGSAGKEKLVAERNAAENRALHLASALQPDLADSVLARINK